MRRHHDVATRSQLLDAGLSRSVIHHALESGELVVVHRGVYSPASAPRSPEQALHAACLAAGPRAVASHRGAAWLWGLTEREWVEITVPRGHSGHLRGCTVHTSSGFTASIRRGIPTTNPLQTIVDLAGVLNDESLWLAFARGVTARLFTPEAVRAENERRRRSGRAGALAVDRLLHTLGPVSVRSPSVLQMAFARLVVVGGLELPVPEFEVLNGRFRIDFAWPAVFLAVELDGWESHGPEQARANHARRRALTSLGWTVIVYTWDDVWRNPERVIAEIREHLSQRQAG